MMQEEEPLQDNDTTNNLLSDNQEAFIQLSKWVRQISVLGFAIGSFVVTAMLFNGAQILKGFAGIIPGNAENTYPVLVASFFLFFFLTALILFYLYKSSQLLTQGVQEKDENLLVQACTYLKRFFIVVGVFAAMQLVFNFSNLF